ncbi:MAG: tetratricopeptide repeat protein, partial [Marmoricola sp.]
GVSSVPYLSRIEAGSRKPGLDLLTIFAERTSTTPAALQRGLPDELHAEIELELQYAALELSTGAARAALERLDALRPRIPDDYRGPMRPHAARLRAGALEGTGDIETAIRVLEDLLDAEPDGTTWIAIATALSRCYRQAGQLRSAVEVGERARTRLSALELEGTTAGIQLSLTVAGALFERGDVADAIDVCTRAIAQSERIESAVAKASAYWNASVIESRRGNTAAALDYARTAMPLMEAAQDARHIARLRSQYGILQLRSGDTAAARTTLREALSALETSASSSPDRTTTRMALAEAELQAGDAATARTVLAAIEPEELAASPSVAAEHAMLQGRLALADQATDEAIRRFRQALDILHGIAADRGLGEIWFELGNLLEDVGDAEAAQTAYRAAAASAGFAARTSARLTSS